MISLVAHAVKINVSSEEPKEIYYVNHGAKVRYIDPLFNGNRMSKECTMLHNGVSQGFGIYFLPIENPSIQPKTIDEVFKLADERMYKNK